MASTSASASISATATPPAMYFKDDGRPAVIAASPSLTHPPSHDVGAIQDTAAAGTSRMVQPQPPSAEADARAVSPLPLHTSVPTMPELEPEPPTPPASASATVMLSPPSTDANATDGQQGHVPRASSSTSTTTKTNAPPPLLQRTSSAARRQMTEDSDPSSHDALYDAIPGRLREGTAMLKVSAKKVQRRMVKLKAEAGQVLWESKHAGMLNIESIRELRFASDARAFREQFKVAPDSEPRWITIIYTTAGKYKVLHLVALTQDDFKLWRQTLSTLYDQRKELMGGLDQMRKRHSVWLKQHWSNADADADQRLSLKDVAALCRNLNISAADRDIQTNFERADAHRRGFLDFADFQVFVKHLRRRPEIEKVMLSVAGNTDSVPLANFKCFLKTTQRSTLLDATLDAIHAKFSDPAPDRPPDGSDAAERVMTMEGFASFLMSSDNSGFSERQLRMCDDMTRPLCEYYISSSHNTYLVGGQLKGESTSEGYIRALQQGCRSVELDVWDGPDEPLIYHGRTLTSKLPARDALLAIAKYAFVASPYPVILSMEVHCDQEQQDKLAEILRSSLGTALIDAPLFGEEAVEAHAGCPRVDALPSPEELKYRILVKAKNLYVVQAAQKIEEPELESESSSSSSSQSSDSDLKRVFSSALRKIRPGASPNLPSPSPPDSHAAKPNPFSWGSPSNLNLTPSERQQSTSSLSVVGAPAIPPGTGAPLERKTSASVREGRRVSLAKMRSRSDRSDTAPSVSSALASGKEKPLMSLALAALIVYTVGVKWRGFNKKEQYGASHVISLGERRAMKTIKEARTDLVAHCRTHLLRAYPAGRRFTSSNYTPLPFWAAGVQLAALNWQTYDLGTELNAAFFQRNGRSGYVLKPGLLRAKKAEEKDKEALARVEKYILMVEVLSAQQLPRPQGSSDGGGSGGGGIGGDAGADVLRSVPMNPFIEVAVHTPTVASGDVAKYTTPVVWGNGFNPVFDSKYQIPFTVPPDMLDLAFLRLEVMVKLGGDEMSLGKYSVSLPVLMPGYRHVPLYDHLGQQYLFSSLFIYTQLQKQPT